MSEEPRFEDLALRLQTSRPRFRWRIVVVFAPIIIFLGYRSFTKHGVYAAYYGGLGALTALALIVQYFKERALINNRLVAVGVVAELRRRIWSRFRILDFIVSRFSGNIPIIKYSFVAFDQKTYTGETGWGSRGLYKGARIPLLYNPTNPAASHPLSSFIFYSFH
jgi:hypothetical protein